MRLMTICLAMLALSACSMLPESWEFENEFWTSDNETVDVEPAEDSEAEKEVDLKLDENQLAKIQVGQTKAEVLEILGPSANVDHGETLADHYVKGGHLDQKLKRFDRVIALKILLVAADTLNLPFRRRTSPALKVLPSRQHHEFAANTHQRQGQDSKVL